MCGAKETITIRQWSREKNYAITFSMVFLKETQKRTVDWNKIALHLVKAMLYGGKNSEHKA